MDIVIWAFMIQIALIRSSIHATAQIMNKWITIFFFFLFSIHAKYADIDKMHVNTNSIDLKAVLNNLQ